MTVAAVMSATGAYLVGRVADQGLANFFGEATLRHGTHPLAWLSIHILGPMPIMGGNRTGGSIDAIAHQNEGRFFLARGLRKMSDASLIKRWLVPRFIPRQYCFLSTDNFLQRFYIPSFLSIPVAVFTAIVLPPIRVRIAQEELEKMPEALHMPEEAVYTDKWILPFNLGTPGTIWNALHYKTPLRMLQEPKRVMTGVAQLAIAGAIAHHVFTKRPDYVTTHRVALVAGVVLGMI